MRDLDNIIAKCEENAVPDTEIDFSDIPPLTDEQLAQMKPCHLVNRDMWQPKKKVLNMRIDADILESLRMSGKGWQKKVNDFLREGVTKGLI